MSTPPTDLLQKEIFEQPDVMQKLLDVGWLDIQRIAAALKREEIRYVFLAARGTSDNAGLYAKYLLGMKNQLPVMLAAPSMFSIYRQPPDLSGALVMAVSQSGQSPEIVSVLEEAGRQNTPTLAITNTPGSPIARTADRVIDLLAGDEKAVAATKSYTAQLMAIALLSAALVEDDGQLALLQQVPGFMNEMLAHAEKIEQIAVRYRFLDRCVVLGRGYDYATVHEWALKLKETAYVLAEPYSSADFQHGPIALVERGFPVMAVAARGGTQASMASLIEELAGQDQAELLILSNDDSLRKAAQVSVPLPHQMDETLSPIVSIVACQLIAMHIARVKGNNPANPRRIQKVTETL